MNPLVIRDYLANHPSPIIKQCGLATISKLLKSIGLFGEYRSLLWVSFAKETYNFKEPTNRSHPIKESLCIFIVQTHTAPHRTTPRHTATHRTTLHHTAPHCTTPHHIALHRTTIHHTAPHCNALHHTAPHCNTLQHTATHSNVLQHTATRCNRKGGGERHTHISSRRQQSKATSMLSKSSCIL